MEQSTRKSANLGECHTRAFVQPVPTSLQLAHQLSTSKCSFHPTIRLYRNRNHSVFRMNAPPPPGSGGPGSNGPPNNQDTDGAPEQQPPSGRTLTQALELTFRNVWIRLMTSGVGKEYNDAIIAFVLAAMAAYKAGYSVNALKLELQANENTNVEPIEGQDLSLNENEKQTRLIWITLVYLTISKTKLVPARPLPSLKSELHDTPLENMLSGLTSLVDSIFEAETKGYTLQSFKMELAMQKDVGQTEQITQSQANVRSQWSRIVFSTLSLLPESLKR